MSRAGGRGPGSVWGAALYECRTTHVRTTPLRRVLHRSTCLWLVDLDRLPRLPVLLRPLARFEARDHLGDPRGTLRGNLDAHLAANGVDLNGGQVLMLAQARCLGRLFNPLTLYWCHDERGTPVCTVVEVSNAHGERHCYLLRPDAEGRADVPEEFYLSPFFGIEGRYRMSVPLPGEQLAVAMHLDHPNGRPFTATLRGRRRPAAPAALLRAALRQALPALAVAAGTGVRGVWPYLREPSLQPRPHQPHQRHRQGVPAP